MTTVATAVARLAAVQSTPHRELPDFPVTSLERLMSQAELQTRIDRKYLVAIEDVPVVLGAVDGRIEVLQIDGRRQFGYRSTYFDTASLAAFHLSGQGRRRRFKVRTRVYRESGETWLEVKTRDGRGATVKDRLPYELADAGRLTVQALEFIAGTLAAREVHGVDLASLEPALHSSYERTTLLLADGAAPSRATIDTGLTWRRPGRTTALSVPGQVIVETKGAPTASALDRALWRCGIRPSRISKYGAGLAALSDLPELKWHRVLNQQLNLTINKPA